MATETAPLLARGYVLSNRILRAIKRRSPVFLHWALRLGVRSIWLGVLDRRRLHWLDERFWGGESLYFDRYRDDMYCDEDFNLSGLFAWEQAAIDEFFGETHRILISSIGGGRETIALRRMGFEVDGFECNQKLLRFANGLLDRSGLDAETRWAPRDECPDFGRVYDGLIIGWGAYDLIQGRERRIAFLRRLRDHAGEGTPVLLSFFTRSPDSRSFKVAAAIASPIRWILRRDPVEVGDVLEPIYFHFFTEDELRAELRAGGFDLRHFTTRGYGHAVGVAI